MRGWRRPTKFPLPLKTTAARVGALRDRLVALHVCTLPELIVLEAVGGLPAYLHWMADETAVSHAPESP